MTAVCPWCGHTDRLTKREAQLLAVPRLQRHVRDECPFSPLRKADHA